MNLHHIRKYNPDAMRIAYVLLTTALLALPVTAAEIAEGDTEQQVLDALGRPQGRMTYQGETVLTYERHVVTLREGRVVAVKEWDSAAPPPTRLWRAVMTPRKTAAEPGAEPQAQPTPSQEKKAAFLPPAYWQGFMQRYPKADVAHELDEARKLAAAKDKYEPIDLAKLTPAKSRATDLQSLQTVLARERAAYGKTKSKGPRRRARQRIWWLKEYIKQLGG